MIGAGELEREVRRVFRRLEPAGSYVAGLPQRRRQKKRTVFSSRATNGAVRS